MSLLPNCSGFNIRQRNKGNTCLLQIFRFEHSPLKATYLFYVNLNLNGIYYIPLGKQHANIMFINKNASHLKNTIKQIPKIVNDRLNKESSINKEPP